MFHILDFFKSKLWVLLGLLITVVPNVQAHTLSLDTSYSLVGNVHLYNLDGDRIFEEIKNSSATFNSNGIFDANIASENSNFDLSLGFSSNSFLSEDRVSLSSAYTQLAHSIIGNLRKGEEYDPKLDVNRNGHVTAHDSLLIINDLGRGFNNANRTFGVVENNASNGFSPFNFLAANMDSKLWDNNSMTIWYSQYDPSGNFLGQGDMTFKLVGQTGTEIPEPGTMLLLGSAALFGYSRKRKTGCKQSV